MKVGVKLFGTKDRDFIRIFSEIVDFIEVMADEKTDLKFLKDIEIPYVIHNKHYAWDVNFCDKNKTKINEDSLKYSIEVADQLGADRIIVHPERITGDSSMEQLIHFINEHHDNRLLIESMPYGDEKTRFLGYDKQSLKRIMDESNVGLCLDLAHSSEAAQAQGLDIDTFIRDLIELKPRHYHISNTKIETIKDLHLNLEDGNLPLKEFKHLLPKHSWVTLETQHNFEKTEHDILFMRQ